MRRKKVDKAAVLRNLQTIEFDEIMRDFVRDRNNVDGEPLVEPLRYRINVRPESVVEFDVRQFV